MENYEKLIAEIDEVVKQIKGLYDLAYTQYSHAVDEVISGRLTDEKQIEHILDGIIDFGDDLRFLELSKSCLLYTSPSPRDQRGSRMPSSA